MGDLVRFGVSLDVDLLKDFDDLIERRGYASRSEAIRDLIREELVRQEWEEDREVAGAITLVYDHHARGLMVKITHTQHDHQGIIISTQHIHLDHHTCLEIIAVRGRASEVVRLAEALKAIKGVRHSTLGMSSTGSSLA